MALLKLQPNKPEIVALQFADGLPVESPNGFGAQVLYSLVDGRKLYAHQRLAAAITQSGAKKGQPLELLAETIEGSKAIQYKARLIEAANEKAAEPSRPAAAPAGASATCLLDGLTAHESSARPSMAARLMGCMRAAIEATQESEAFAQRHGIALTFDAADIRALAISVFIQSFKEGF